LQKNASCILHHRKTCAVGNHIFQCIRIHAIQATEVDAPYARILARLMEGLDTAHLAKEMLRGTRIELIHGQRFSTFNDVQIIDRKCRRHQCALASTQTAIAACRGNQRGTHFKFNGSAMARTCVVWRLSLGIFGIHEMSSCWQCLLYIRVLSAFCISMYLQQPAIQDIAIKPVLDTWQIRTDV
jgi:hypothetical protein